MRPANGGKAGQDIKVTYGREAESLLAPRVWRRKPLNQEKPKLAVRMWRMYLLKGTITEANKTQWEGSLLQFMFSV